MKAIKWFAPRDMRLTDIEKPVPKPHEALVRVESIGVCGSDMHYYEDGAIGQTRITEPLILGHEFAGIVEAVGKDADPALVGKRVAVEPSIPCGECEWCRTGHYNVCTNLFFPGGPPYDGVLCEYAAYDANNCYPTPDGMSAQEAAMIEPLAVAVHAVELARVQRGETAAVLGLGPIGLLTAQVAKLKGIEVVYGTDLHDYRVAASKRYGVDHAYNAETSDTVETIMRETNGRGVDVAFDAARSSDTPALACRVTRPVGRCILIGISGTEEDPFPVSNARRKELTVQWCRRFKSNFPEAIDLVATGKVDVSSIVTHSFPLERAPEAFALVAGFSDNVLKASVDL
ncbi:MAG: alcohol dehydrogenase catalytic domain-containing protein [Nitrospiraceae bacterium]|nr:alcohol dehydrogenase catalytic domain-containing protein [Nitrospiraceae bacterium]